MKWFSKKRIDTRGAMVVTRGRTRSTWFIERLGADENVQAVQEILSPTCDHHFKTQVNGICLGRAHVDTNSEFLLNLSEVSNGLRASGVHIVFKALLGHLRHWGLTVEDFVGWNIIFLTRNPVDEAISGAYARATGKFNVFAHNKKGLQTLREQQQIGVEVDTEFILKGIGYSNFANQAFRKSLGGHQLSNFLEIDSDELLSPQLARHLDQELSKLLGTELRLGISETQQMLVNPSRQISNWSEVQVALRAKGHLPD